MFGAIARGQAASSALCAANGADLEIVDVGVDADLAPAAGAAPEGTAGGPRRPGEPEGRGPAPPAARVAHAKVARGSSSFLRGPAMTPGQCRSAMEAGAAAVARACERAAAGARGAEAAAAEGGAPLAAGAAPAWRGLAVAIGELGIGNTTAASALVAALTGAAPEAVVGRGTGVGDAGLAAKRRAVAAALEANAALIAGGGALGALQAAGGLELAAMAGAFIEAARRRLPAVVDGFVSGAAALAAARIDPSVRGCLFASHRSAEAAAGLVLEELGLAAPLHMGMRLGEVRRGAARGQGERARAWSWRRVFGARACAFNTSAPPCKYARTPLPPPCHRSLRRAPAPCWRCRCCAPPRPL
jgi:NaMN:DMB phosphoribosyltransferase